MIGSHQRLPLGILTTGINRNDELEGSFYQIHEKAGGFSRSSTKIGVKRFKYIKKSRRYFIKI
jgi:hypothetical protein